MSGMKIAVLVGYAVAFTSVYAVLATGNGSREEFGAISLIWMSIAMSKDCRLME